MDEKYIIVEYNRGIERSYRISAIFFLLLVAAGIVAMLVPWVNIHIGLKIIIISLLIAILHSYIQSRILGKCNRIGELEVSHHHISIAVYNGKSEDILLDDITSISINGASGKNSSPASMSGELVLLITIQHSENKTTKVHILRRPCLNGKLVQASIIKKYPRGIFRILNDNKILFKK